MRIGIGTRLTVTTSVLVAITLGLYSWMSLRSRHNERTDHLIDEGRRLADALYPRAMEGVSAAELSRVAAIAGPWTAEVLSADAAPPPDAPPTADAKLEALRKLLVIRDRVVYDDARIGGKPMFLYLDPIRVTTPTPDGSRIAGALLLTRDKSDLLKETAAETRNMLISMALLIGALVLAVSLSARRDISKPLQKLLSGIDDVAKGDLSHVLLAEREDEVGDLAARFNDMTGSLRDARAETQRGIDTKLALEAHLRRTEKLATIGQVAAEIAHEVGTPLNVVTGRARAMARKAEDPDAVQKNATIIAEQAARITRIIQRLLDFARRKVGDAEKVTVDLNRLAGDTLEFLEHQLANAHIDARPRLDKGIAGIPGDKDQLQQVLLNLFLNAIQAMPDGGRLDIVSSRVVRRRPGLEVAPEQEYAVLEVRDTGVGIPEESRDKIFEPFYTSKAGEGGTGLGLAVAHGIVKDHDGWIEIDDNAPAGRGTVFRLFFPMKSINTDDGGARVVHDGAAV